MDKGKQINPAKQRLEDDVFKVVSILTRPIVDAKRILPGAAIKILLDQLSAGMDQSLKDDAEKWGLTADDIQDCCRRALMRALNTKGMARPK